MKDFRITNWDFLYKEQKYFDLKKKEKIIENISNYGFKIFYVCKRVW